MPGMAANSLIFEKIKLDPTIFECFYLEWLEPFKNENIKAYSKRLSAEIKHNNPVLIGVSLGGILVQEIAKQITVKKVIIISSVKDPSEFPLRMKYAQKMKLYYLFPTRFFNSFENVTKKIVSSKKIIFRLEMYEKYLTVRSQNYLNWAFKNAIEWKNENPISNIIHIHGTKDHIFPHLKIKNAILIPNATHVLVLLQYKWLNINLPQLILKDNYEKKLD